MYGWRVERFEAGSYDGSSWSRPCRLEAAARAHELQHAALSINLDSIAMMPCNPLSEEPEGTSGT